ncbi:deoxynucleotide monophosphate kinase family protein [Streptomyces sp. NPDC000851]
MRDIALTGLARAGKDSVAARLVNHHGYVRVAFADRLKEAALKADPIIHAYTSFCDEYDHETEEVRLSAVVFAIGWEAAKDQYPEVRRFLQHYGQTVREIRPTFWVEAAFADIRAAHAQGRPVVVTDVRYTNEAEALMAAGFAVVRIERPGQTPGQHVSEREMLDYPADWTIVNSGSLADLAQLADSLVS